MLLVSDWQYEDADPVWSADSQWLAIARGKDLILWNKSHATVLRKLELPAASWGAGFSDDAALLMLKSVGRVGVVRVSDGAYIEHWQIRTDKRPVGFFVAGRDWGGDDAAAALLLFRSGPDIAIATLTSLDQAVGVRRVESMLDAFAKGDVRGRALPEVALPVATADSSSAGAPAARHSLSQIDSSAP